MLIIDKTVRGAKRRLKEPSDAIMIRQGNILQIDIRRGREFLLKNSVALWRWFKCRLFRPVRSILGTRLIRQDGTFQERFERTYQQL
jgi:hypothetical protein